MLSLRRFERAAHLFAVELRRRRRPAVPADGDSRARFAVRQATAPAGVGRLDDACPIVEATLPVIKRIDSATVRAEPGRFVERARTRNAGPGRLALTDASAALTTG
ncbi:hypothetical protein [Streptomyces sp. H51]|uniref:hypothetical protein n=1 Tax=Streptomyces sp. H51 TaxID=3111770 RepID=UPI002D77F190|nr:hypothetical protein [Streptomyces sp. H51]